MWIAHQAKGSLLNGLKKEEVINSSVMYILYTNTIVCKLIRPPTHAFRKIFSIIHTPAYLGSQNVIEPL